MNISSTVRLFFCEWKGLVRVCLGGLPKLSQREKQRCQKHELRSLKSFLFSFSQPNGFAQRMLAIFRLARMNRSFLSKSKCHTLCTITIPVIWWMKCINYVRDKYLKEYRTSKNASYSYLDIKHLHLIPKAILTEEKQPCAQREYFTSLTSPFQHLWQNLS